MRSLAITEAALPFVGHPDFPLNEVLSENVPNSFSNAIIIAEKDVVLVATESCTEGDRLLIIGKSGTQIFDEVALLDWRDVLDRCIRIALRSFSSNRIALNPGWLPFRQDNRVSLFASATSHLRIIAETNFGNSKNTYVFNVLSTEKARNLTALTPDIDFYSRIVRELSDLFAKARTPALTTDGHVELGQLPITPISKGLGYDNWYSRLSTKQREFVDLEVSGPLRVRGAAGTGKTLAMVMKALKIARDGAEPPPRILFLTHSWAMAEQVDEMIRQIGHDIPHASRIEVFPLLAISAQRDYSVIGRQPLGNDSDQGKRETLGIISELVDKFKRSNWRAYRSGCSPEFISAIEAPENSDSKRALAWDLLIEFGCVLASQGLLGREADRERYLRVRRMGYMMRLSTPSEKQAVFDLWRSFLEHLKEYGFISTDQIVSDYLNELQTFYWEAARLSRGWTHVFVDEMHLFNAQERLIFHNLLANGDEAPRVIMALDPKQSPREIFADVSDENDELSSSSIYARAKLPNPEKIDLVEVYRYTPEIQRLIKDVMNSLPALDMGDDWNIPLGLSVTDSGPNPIYFIEKSRESVFKKMFELAKAKTSEARERGGQVAILCLDYERFNQYYVAAEVQYKNDVFVIRSRDDIDKLRYMNRRIVLSMPEYVAGLQFDTVILADANSNLIPDAGFRGHAERRFVSELYLGMSRAEHTLMVIASQDGDGLSSYLEVAAQRGFIEAG